MFQDHIKYKAAQRARKPEAKLRTILRACQGVTKDELSGAPQPKYRCAVAAVHVYTTLCLQSLCKAS